MIKLLLITIGNINTLQDTEDVMIIGTDFITLGRALINEPRWVQKVESNDEISIRLQINQNGMDDLSIPAGIQDYLLRTYRNTIHFTSILEQEKYSDQMTLMERDKKH